MAQRINGIALTVMRISMTTTVCAWIRCDALLAGKTDITGEKRIREADRGKALAAHATSLIAWSWGPSEGDGPYIKVSSERPSRIGLNPC